MLVIGLHAKKGGGKTTIARKLSPMFEYPLIYSFAEPLKEETSAHFGFPKALCYTEEGKNTIIDVCDINIRPPGGFSFTVRALLQWYGTEYRRAQNKTYWIEKVLEAILEAERRGHKAVILDDVRFKNEAKMVKDLNGYLFKVRPYPGWIAGEGADHQSEIDLDNYSLWNAVYTPVGNDTEAIAHSIKLYIGLFPPSMALYSTPHAVVTTGGVNK